MTQDKDQMRAEFEQWAATQADKWLLVGGLTWSPGTNDYASARTNAAWEAWQAARASAPQGVPQQFSHALEKLQRFEECASDFDADGVDIGREWLDALTKLGLLERVQRSPAMWQITASGESLLAASQQKEAQ